MKFLIVILFCLPLNLIKAEIEDIKISKLIVLKRNKPSCNRLGNVYDACQWMLKFTLNNNSNRDLKSFCAVIKINKGKYEICSNKKQKDNYLKANKSKVILNNLNILINYENDKPKPMVKVLSLKGKFVKQN